jgi:hypothetical protein
MDNWEQSSQLLFYIYDKKISAALLNESRVL